MILITAVALTLACSAQQGLPPDSAVRAFLVPRVGAFPDSGKHGEGIVVGLLDANGTRRIVAVGVDSTRVFEIGSITKVFTTSVLEDMVERGELRLDDPVAKLLPPSVQIPSRNGRQVTLLDLATQSSGLPRLPTNLAPRDSSNPYADYSVQQLYTFLAGYELTRDIGAEYEYSNLGMGLLGHALALKARTSYEDLVRRRILAPLGMRETAITLTPALRARIAPGHDAEGNVVPNWDLPTLAGAGALRSTAADMLKFLAANLDSTATPLSRTLYRTHAERHATNAPSLKIGLGWHILSRPVGNIVWHNGGTGGYRTYAGFDPARRLGVVVLSNVDASVDDAQISFERDTTGTVKGLVLRQNGQVIPGRKIR
jgi:CubicO group peptidase (beta-lactamase class C family)